MFRHTSRQVSLFQPRSMLSESVSKRLRGTWSEEFHRQMLPVLLDLEEEFADLYSDTGRPNWSVARLVGLNIIQAFQGLDDQAVLDSLSFDVRFQHALGFGDEDPYLSRRSYVAFRARLAHRDPGMTLIRNVFLRVGSEAMEDLGLSMSKQRIDSTHIVSNIRTRGRSDLFGKTLRHFVSGLRDRWPERLARLGAELREWALESEEGWFGLKGGDQRVALAQRARWAHEVIVAFAEDPEVSQDERYQLVVRVFHEHCEYQDKPPRSPDRTGADAVDQASSAAGLTTTASSESSEPSEAASSSCEPRPSEAASEAPADVAKSTDVTIAIRPGPKPAGASLQSPFDPDAGYGHKGSGYHVHVTETCGNESAEIITDFCVVPAHTADCTQLVPTLERLAEHERSPEVLLADGGYANVDNMNRAQALNVRLHAPISAGRLPDDYVGRDRFAFDDSGRVLSCPEGHAPTRHDQRSPTNGKRSDKTLHAYFDGATCRACPLVGRCAVRPPNNSKKGSFHLDLHAQLRERDEALARQKTPEWREAYKLRSGVESCMAELKGPHGLGRLRVRRRARVLLAVAFKLLACNTKRWLRARLEAGRAPAGRARELAFRLWTLVVATMFILRRSPHTVSHGA